jgi:hypothetical protein
MRDTSVQNDNIKILVCAHKAADFPPDKIFLPVQAGRALPPPRIIDVGIQGDDTGENISAKNPRFCELTVLYWAWKNLKNLYPHVKYVGLCHYRRYFALDKKFGNVFYRKTLPAQTFSGNLIQKYLKKYQIIAGQPQSYRYSLHWEYCLGFNVNDYRAVKQIIHELYPEYDRAFKKVYEFGNKLSSCNMFIARYSFLEKYCAWLFPILLEAEKRIDFKNYDEWQVRELAVFGEVLLNVYIHHNKLNVLYKPVYSLTSRRPKFTVYFSRFVLNVIRNFFYFFYIRPGDWLAQYLININKPEG